MKRKLYIFIAKGPAGPVPVELPGGNEAYWVETFKRVHQPAEETEYCYIDERSWSYPEVGTLQQYSLKQQFEPFLTAIRSHMTQNMGLNVTKVQESLDGIWDSELVHMAAADNTLAFGVPFLEAEPVPEAAAEPAAAPGQWEPPRPTPPLSPGVPPPHSYSNQSIVEPAQAAPPKPTQPASHTLGVAQQPAPIPNVQPPGGVNEQAGYTPPAPQQPMQAPYQQCPAQYAQQAQQGYYQQPVQQPYPPQGAGYYPPAGQPAQPGYPQQPQQASHLHSVLPGPDYGKLLSRGAKVWCIICLSLNALNALVFATQYGMIQNTLLFILALLLQCGVVVSFSLLLTGRKVGFYMHLGFAGLNILLNLISLSFVQAGAAVLNPLITWMVIKNSWSRLR